MPVDVNSRTDYSEELLHCPKPFEAVVRPRFRCRRRTVTDEFERAEREVFAKYGILGVKERISCVKPAKSLWIPLKNLSSYLPQSSSDAVWRSSDLVLGLL